jgi:hypothetical protein
MSKTGPLFLAEMKRRTTTGGGSLLAWWFAFFALGDPHTSCMTCGPGPPCHRLGCFGARRARFSVASRGASEGVSLEKGFTPSAAVKLSHFLYSLRPFAFELSAPLCIRAPQHSAAVVAMALLAHPERFQSEVAPNLLRNLLGWGTPAFARRICADASPLGDLAAGEFVLFVSYISCGLALSISSFFLLLLGEFGLQLQHEDAVGWHFFCQCPDGRVLRNDLLEMESELSCSSIFCMNFIASCSDLVSCSLNFTSTSGYTSMDWSSSGSASAVRPPSVVRCRASISLALVASTSPPTMVAPSP